MPVNPNRIAVKLSDEDKAWCEARAEELGLDDMSGVVKMLIRQARKGNALVPQGPTPEQIRKAEIARQREELQAKLRALEADGDNWPEYEQQFDEIDVPADPDGGVVTWASPYVVAGPPGSVTAPAGVNPNVAHGNRMGDSRNNVVRSNFAHLGYKP